MSATQYQHYAPKSYLNGWASNGRLNVTQWRHETLITKAKSPSSTGGREGLYYVPMAEPDRRNYLENKFWLEIDQWGADGLKLVRDKRPDAASQVNRERLAVFINSFAFRNPVAIKRLNDAAKRQVLSGCLSEDYSSHRRAHEPDTLEEFKAQLEQPFLCEMGADLLRTMVLNKGIIEQLLSMNWQVVTITNGEPILTSDNPLIRYGGMKEQNGAWILPLSADECFIAFNNSNVDMIRLIEENIRTGNFVNGVNKYVVAQKIDAVYGATPSLMPLVARHFCISEEPYMPGFESVSPA